MQRRNMYSVVLRLIAVVGVLAGALTVVGCSGGDNSSSNQTVLVAKTDSEIPVTAETVPAIENQTFTFDSGESLTPALANQPIAVTFTDTTSATPTATVTAPNITGTDGRPASFSGATEFGSCTFRVTKSTFPPGQGPQVGDTITVNPCRVSARTGGITTLGTTTAVQILLALGATASRANLGTVCINCAGETGGPIGHVTLNGVRLPSGVGDIELQLVTGGGGSSPT